MNVIQRISVYFDNGCKINIDNVYSKEEMDEKGKEIQSQWVSLAAKIAALAAERAVEWIRHPAREDSKTYLIIGEKISHIESRIVGPADLRAR